MSHRNFYSGEDYLLQIIWFAFHFSDPNKLTTPDIYKHVLKDCRKNSLFNQLESIKTKNHVELLLDKILEFHSDVGVKEVRRKRLNNLKNAVTEFE